MKRLATAVLIAGAVLTTSVSTASAATIYESATLGETGEYPGEPSPQINIYGTQFAGFRFSTAEDFIVTAIGGHFMCCDPTGGDSLFLAVVPVYGSPSFPSSITLDEALFWGLLIADPSVGLFSKEYTVSLPNEYLPAGEYAIVAGSGLFGATGEGWAPLNDLELPGYDDFLRQSTDMFIDGNVPNQRVFLEGTPAPVPLPTALPLLMSALGFFGFFGWRRKRLVA